MEDFLFGCKEKMWLEDTWLAVLPHEVWEAEIVARMPVETLLQWPEVPLEALRRAAGEDWHDVLRWSYVTATGPQECHAEHLVEVHDVDLPYDWVCTYRFFRVTPFTKAPNESVRRSLFHVFPHATPLLHLHKSWIHRRRDHEW